MTAERESFEERAGRLKDQLEAESAARAFAEGALQSARQDRGGRRPGGEPAAAAKDAGPPSQDEARDKVAKLR